MPQSAPCLDNPPPHLVTTPCCYQATTTEARTTFSTSTAAVGTCLSFRGIDHRILGKHQPSDNKMSQDTSHSTSCSGDIGTNFPVVFATCPDVASHQKVPKRVGNGFFQFHETAYHTFEAHWQAFNCFGGGDCPA